MSSYPTYSNDAHPSDRVLDRLRAGLFDAEQDALRAHLSECRTCQGRMALWSRAKHILEDAANERGIASRLGARRRRALAGVAATRRLRSPVVAGLAVAVTAMAIGLGVFFANDRDDPEAAAVAAAPSPDFYADIVFYIWLMEKQANPDGSNG